MATQVIQFRRREGAPARAGVVPLVECVNLNRLMSVAEHNYYGFTVRAGCPALGLRAGDLLVVDSDARPRAGDLAVYEDHVREYDAARGGPARRRRVHHPAAAPGGKG